MAKLSLNYYQALHVGKVKTDVIQFTTIQAAIDAITDNATGKRYAVYVHPGTYDEQVTMEDYVDLIAVGGREETIIYHGCDAHDEPTVTGENSMIKGFTIISDGTNGNGNYRTRCVNGGIAGFEMENCILTAQNNAAAGTEIALNATASCDIRDCVVDSGGVSVIGALFTTAAQTYNVEGTTFNGATDAIQVTLAITALNLTNCTLTDNFNQDGGTVNTYRSRLEALALGTADCTFRAEFTQFTGAITTAAEARDHDITLIKCDLQGEGVDSNATGATTLDMRDCSNAGKLTNDGTGDWDVRVSDVQDCETTSSGNITIYGGDVGTCAGASAGGAIVWWRHQGLIYVMPSMLLAHAVAAAVAAGGGNTIQLSQGTWAESNLVVERSINFIGEGPEKSIVSAASANPIFQVGDVTTDTAVSCTFQGLKIENSDAGEAIELVAGVDGALGTTVVVRECLLDGTDCVRLAAAGDAAKTFEAFETEFNATTVCIDVDATVAADIDIHNCEFVASAVADLTGNDHDFDAWDCEMGGGAITVAANAPTIDLTRCNDVGTITNLTGAMRLEHCTTGDVSTTTGGVTIEHSNVGILASGNATVNVYNSYVTEAQPSDGAQNFYQCTIAEIDADGGTITVYGGDIRSITDNTGTIIWWIAPHTLRVIESTADMKIMDAADAAAAGDLILIGPGTFSEALDLDTAVNACTYRGMGRDKTIITATGNTVLVDGITGVIFEDLTIVASAGTDGQYAIELDASTTATASVTLRNVTVDMTGTAGGVRGLQVIDDGTKVATVEAYNCSFEADSGANNYAVVASPCTTATSSIKLYDCILNGTTYDILNEYITIETHDCELNGGGWYLANNATAIGLAFNNEAPGTVTRVTFAGTAGQFADLSGAQLYTCDSGVAIGEAVYVTNAGYTVDEATNAVATPLPAQGVVAYKPTTTTCYVIKHGYLYLADPNTLVGTTFTAGDDIWLGVDGAWLNAKPSNTVKQLLGVAVGPAGAGAAKAFLIDIALVNIEVGGGVLSIPIAWGAGSAPTGTHVSNNARRAVAIVQANGQTVFSQAVGIPEDYLHDATNNKLYAVLFPTGSGNIDWTAYTCVAANGEDEALHSDTATADNQATVDDQILFLDISLAFLTTYVAAEGDILSIDLVIDAMDNPPTQVNVLGFRLEYTKQS